MFTPTIQSLNCLNIVGIVYMNGRNWVVSFVEVSKNYERCHETWKFQICFGI